MENDELILTIDVGTSSCKSNLYDPDGRTVASAFSAYDTCYPEAGWAEQRPADWWSAVVTSVRRACAQDDSNTRRIAAIGVTGQMHCLVALTAKGTTVGNVLTLQDQRATEEVDQLNAQIGLAEVYRLTGARLSPGAPLAKLVWMKRHRQDLYAEARWFLPCKDYIRYLLTEEIATDHIDAAGTLLYDLRKREWSDVLLETCGLAQSCLPPIREAWELAGRLRKQAAEQLGLGPGIPVVVGGGDDIEFLGMGLVEPGSSLEHFGTTGSIVTCVEHPVPDPELAIELYPHLDPAMWLLGGSVSNAGGALSWAARVLFDKKGTDARVELDHILQGEISLAPSTRPLIFIPHLNGERCPTWSPDSRGAWLGLSAEHGDFDLYRAVAEGAVFSLKSVLERIQALGAPTATIRVGAEPSHMRTWLRTRANIYDREIQVMGGGEPTSLGAMILAGMGIGMFKDMRQGVQRVVSTNENIAPDTAIATRYAALYGWYQEAVALSAPLFGKMALERSFVAG